MKKNKKNLKIKWENVALLGVLLICTYLVLHDLFMVTIYTWISGNIYGWTWLGITTFMIAFSIGAMIIEHFIEEANE